MHEGQIRDGYVSAVPFQEWAERWIARLAKGLGNGFVDNSVQQEARTELARILGIKDVHGKLTDWLTAKSLPRVELENALERTDTPFWELYGIEMVDLESEAFCDRCHENVTPLEGRCPWCDSKVCERHTRRWCERENRLMYPSMNSTCWRCGDSLRSIPWVECACGCGRRIPGFDPQGRPSKWARGHNAKVDGAVLVPAEPLARHLESELAKIDVIGALAREHGLKRDEVVAILKRSQDELPISHVRRVLWTGTRAGGGKGAPPRVDRPQLRELYPEFVRSKECPRCGKGKAPHAELCKACRKKQDRVDGWSPPKAKVKIREELILSAHRRYWEDGATMILAAEEIFGETGHRTVDSTMNALRKEWDKRELPRRTRTHPRATT